MIELAVLDDEHELWGALLDLAGRHAGGWTLIGGQMVRLHALAAGAPPHRVSRDLDLVVDVRVRPDVLGPIVTALGELGFDLAAPGMAVSVHRFTRGAVIIDVLVPDGLGERNHPRLGNLRALAVSGGSAALRRTVPMRVRFAGRVAAVPVPDLVGALVIKSAAAALDRGRGPERHLRDLGLLYSLVDDPDRVAASLTPGSGVDSGVSTPWSTRTTTPGWRWARSPPATPTTPSWRSPDTERPLRGDQGRPPPACPGRRLVFFADHVRP